MDKKTGFTKVPNWLFEELYQSGMNGSCFSVFLYIYRMTIGFNKNSDRLSMSRIVKETGISKSSVVRAMQCLQKEGWIKIGKKKNHKTFYDTNTITVLRGGVRNDTNSVSKMTQYQINGKANPSSDGCLAAPSSEERNNRWEDIDFDD